MVADLEQVVEKIDASEIHNEKLNAKEMSSPTLVTTQKNRRWTIKICWRRSGSEDIQLDRGQRTQNEEKFKKTFLENQTGLHQPPKQEVFTHQHSLHRDQ